MGAEDATVDSDSDDSDFDPGATIDSDYDIGDGDDDLYADNVDMDEHEDGKDKGKQGVQATKKGKGTHKGKGKSWR